MYLYINAMINKEILNKVSLRLRREGIHNYLKGSQLLVKPEHREYSKILYNHYENQYLREKLILN
ncbi:hypothetical protein OKW21_006068 [Catalinimonas alkaloidigena]|nr:hypothetical protein [Catalinimonas alkaloidigena]